MKENFTKIHPRSKVCYNGGSISQLLTSFYQDFTEFEFPRFIQGPYLKTTLTMLPHSAKEQVLIMVPYLVRSSILDSILNLPGEIKVKLYTRSAGGYLPNIKSGAAPALKQLIERDNIEVFINNKIHSKIWVIDNSFAIVHSMNGTFHSEEFNYEAGIVSVEQNLIKEIVSYFQFVENQCEQLK